MKRKNTALLLALGLLFLTSCDTVEGAVRQAVDDTFREPVVRRKAKPDEEKTLWDHIVEAVLDESNKPVHPSETIADAEDKAGFKFSLALRGYFQDYLMENDMARYLREDEVWELINAREERNFLLHPVRIRELTNTLLRESGWEDAEVMYGAIHVYSESFNLTLINPDNPEVLDGFSYTNESGAWSIQPRKVPGLSRDLRSVSLREFPLESLDLVMETAREVFRKMGEDREHDFTDDPWYGIYTVNSRFEDGELIFEADVKGTKDEYNLIFNRDGKLIRKEER